MIGNHGAAVSSGLGFLAIQCVAWLLVGPSDAELGDASARAAIAWGAVAGGLALVLGARPVQCGLHAALPPAAALAFALGAPAWLWALAFVAAALVFWNAARGDAPLYLSSRSVVEALAEIAPRDGRVIDLGCGFGGLVLALARARPDLRVEGVDVAPAQAAIGALRARRAPGGRITIRLADFRSIDLSGYDVVYCFLSPPPMPAVVAKAKAELGAGGVLISNAFRPAEPEPDRSWRLADGSILHLWRGSGEGFDRTDRLAQAAMIGGAEPAERQGLEGQDVDSGSGHPLDCGFAGGGTSRGEDFANPGRRRPASDGPNALCITQTCASAPQSIAVRFE